MFLITEVMNSYCPLDRPVHQTTNQNCQLKPYGVLITHENDSLAYYIDTESFESVSDIIIMINIINDDISFL